MLNGGHQRQHGLEKRINVTMGLVGCDVYFIRERRSVLLVRGGERKANPKKKCPTKGVRLCDSFGSEEKIGLMVG